MHPVFTQGDRRSHNQFDDTKILGQGGEAKVYFSEIFIDSQKTPVAVKRLKENSEVFEREIHTLSKIQHPNLVSLIGYCNESGHNILVYEYMAKGCLSDYLRKNNPIPLSWIQRLNICLGVARGLQHLHMPTDEFSKGIIHRDVKPGNILVGENWVGKLSDFGIFKLSNAGQDKSLMTTNIKGTHGYFAPEYIKHGHVTRKIDAYAFGIVLFQVLCRKMPWDREGESYYMNNDDDLGFWAHQNVDAQIEEEISGDSLTIFTDIIRRSLQTNPDNRPTMDGVVMDLQKALECQESESKQLDLDYTIKSVGPWGGEGGPNEYNYMGKGEISHISIRHEVGNIKAIRFTSQDKNGRLEKSRIFGGEGGYYQSAEIVLDTKREKLVGISGTVGTSFDYMVITSLKFYTSTNRSFGPFGPQVGTPFSYSQGRFRYWSLWPLWWIALK